MKKVIVIVGPTASGKTTLSVKLAKALKGQIINGDSVQIYQGLDIGSAKITKEEKQGVIHHMLDVCDPSTSYSVFQFQKDVRHLLSTIERPIIVGGTGLYIKAALFDYSFYETGRDESFEQAYKDLSNEDIYQELRALDPQLTIDQMNRRRLLRALEQAKSGHLRSKKTNKDTPLYDCFILYLDLPKEVLEQRLKTRLEAQLEQGFIKEVQELVFAGIQINAIGYRELSAYISKDISLDEAKTKILKASKHLAKKQKTFFKNQMNTVMFDALDPDLYEKTLTSIKVFLGDQK